MTNTQFTILLFCFRQRSTEERRHIHTGYVLFDAKSVGLISLSFLCFNLNWLMNY